MKTIEKIIVNNSCDAESPGYVLVLINKVNELIQKINDLNFEVAGIHEWKIEKEGI